MRAKRGDWLVVERADVEHPGPDARVLTEAELAASHKDMAARVARVQREIVGTVKAVAR